MTIKGKLAGGFLAVALLAAVAGGFGISATKQIVRMFEGGEEHFRSIIWAATEATSYAKRAEGHLLQYLTLHDPSDREKFFLRYASLEEQIGILDRKVALEEGRRILARIQRTQKGIRQLGAALIAAHDQARAAGLPFRIEAHAATLRRLDVVVETVDKAGLQLARYETSFLNKQESITAATELSSFIKQAEKHLILYLALGQSSDRDAFYGFAKEVEGETDRLAERLKTPESRALLARIGDRQDVFFRFAGQLVRQREQSQGGNAFDFQTRAQAIRVLNEASSEIREAGVQIAKTEAALESRLKNETIERADAVRRNILLAILAAVTVSLVIGWVISRAVLVPINRLKRAAAEIGQGNLDVRIEAGDDEIGVLATAFNSMAGELKTSLVSVDYVENILASMLDGLVVMDADRRIRRVNVAAVRMSGYEEAELVGSPPDLLLAGAGALVESVLESGQIGNAEGILRTKDGGETPVLFSVSAMPKRDSCPAGVVFAFRDISDLKRSEGEKRELQAQLLHAQKMETIGTLAGGIAHDFNNLLTPILGYSRLCHDEVPLRSDAATHLERVIAAAERARDLVRQIVTFSRQDNGERRPFRVDQVAHDAISLLRASVPKSIVLRDEIEEGATAIANSTQFHQVLMNLATNALHAMEGSGGVLTIKLETVRSAGAEGRPFDSVLLTVKDTGCGMDPTTIGRIFEPFFTTKGVGKGTGLGLSVVHGIVVSHGGRITVDSRPGEGAVFRVQIPGADRSRQEGKPVLRSLPSGDGGHVLLVDDEEAILLLARAMLERLGFRTTLANDPSEAVAIFQAAPGTFDAVITDLAMPRLDGLGLAHQLRRIRPDLPVILLTGFIGGFTTEEFAHAGIDVCIAKPFTSRDLDRAIRQALEKRRAKEFPFQTQVVSS